MLTLTHSPQESDLIQQGMLKIFNELLHLSTIKLPEDRAYRRDGERLHQSV